MDARTISLREKLHEIDALKQLGQLAAAARVPEFAIRDWLHNPATAQLYLTEMCAIEAAAALSFGWNPTDSHSVKGSEPKC